ncbi:MAG: acetyl-CoA carboxylase biotin carboxyl carrier protein subunit, partial [Proteobacteria bacterium]|nr:acetyl-CoA carboxylase biotin carboxyl carrier protein subunit [Pseudomonadota bacterium]
YVEYEHEEELFCYEYTAENQKILINRKLFERISTSTASNIKLTPEGITLQLDEKFITAKVTENKNNITLNDGFGDIVFKKLPKFSDPNELIIEGSLTAPMPGKILKINIKKGSQVSQGEALIILEAMKMEHTIKANTEGTVTEVFVKVGDQVENGADLMKVE